MVAACMNTQEVNSRYRPVTDIELVTYSTVIKNSLKDPDSAKFADWSGYDLSNGDRVICGKLNAKNSFGAYNGYEPFYIRRRGDGIQSVHRGRNAEIGCSRAASGNYKIMPS